MAAPAVVGTPAETAIATAGTSHVVNLPSGATGNLMIAIMDKGSTAATVGALSGWNELLDENQANGLYVAWRLCDGTEGATTTFTLSAATRGAWIVYEISGAADPATTPPAVATTASGTSATPDPPSITPPSSKDYLFIAFAGMAGEELDDDTWGNTPPTNYTPSPPRQKSCGTAGTNLGGLILSAERQLTTGSAQNPGTFGVDVSAAWRAQHIIVHPAPPTPTATSVARVSLAAATTPDVDTGHAIKLRARKASGSGTVTMKAALYEGGTNRSGDLETSALTTSLADYTLPIAEANAANITSYADLELRFWGASSTGDTVNVEVAELWLEVPAGTPAGPTGTASVSARGPSVITSAGTKGAKAAPTVAAVSRGGIVSTGRKAANAVGAVAARARGAVVATTRKGASSAAAVAARALGVVTGTGQKGGRLAAAVSARGAGQVIAVGQKAGTSSSAVTGGGHVTSTGIAQFPEQHSGTSAVTGGGHVTSSGVAAFPEQHSGTATVSARARGFAAATGRKDAAGASALSGGGSSAALGRKAAAATAGASSRGAAVAIGVHGGVAACRITAGGTVTTFGEAARFAVTGVRGGGHVIVAGSSIEPAGPASTSRTRAGGSSGRTRTLTASGRTIAGGMGPTRRGE